MPTEAADCRTPTLEDLAELQDGLVSRGAGTSTA